MNGLEKAIKKAGNASNLAALLGIKGGHVEQFCRFLAELGIQLAPPGAVLVRRDYLFSVETLADIGMKAVRMQPEPLGWD